MASVCHNAKTYHTVEMVEDTPDEEGECSSAKQDIKKPRVLKRPQRPTCGRLPFSQTDESLMNSRPPLQTHSLESVEEDFQINDRQPSRSTLKPQKLRRLRRVCELEPVSQAKQNLQKHHGSVKDRVKNKVQHSKSRAGTKFNPPLFAI